MIRRIVCWIVDIAVALSLAWFCLHSFGTKVVILGQSMTPTCSSGDVVLMNRLAYDIGNPAVGDLVVFERADQKENVKRVVGIPGDVIQIKDGWLYVNDVPVEDELLGPVTDPGIAKDPVELQEDEYFLLGDNRDSSEDSRFANIGNVSKDQIIGKIWIRIFPLRDFGPIRFR